MKYFEFQIQEKHGEYEFLSVHFIEAEIEKEALEYADAYIRDFRGCETANKGLNDYEYSWDFGSLVVEMSCWREIENIDEWMEVQKKKMQLQYSKEYVDEIKEMTAKAKEQQAQELEEIMERNDALNKKEMEEDET